MYGAVINDTNRREALATTQSVSEKSGFNGKFGLIYRLDSGLVRKMQRNCHEVAGTADPKSARSQERGGAYMNSLNVSLTLSALSNKRVCGVSKTSHRPYDFAPG